MQTLHSKSQTNIQHGRFADRTITLFHCAHFKSHITSVARGFVDDSSRFEDDNSRSSRSDSSSSKNV